jgi:DeoR/GlpR family transcriptional regulator of sugar metabolism
LRDTGFIRTTEMCAEFAVTPMTLWRDLKYLEEQGLLLRIRGGATSRQNVAGEMNYESKEIRAHEAKKIIAHLAVEAFVREGDTLALEGGTTVAALVNELPESRVSILTNSLPVAQHVRKVRPGLAVQIAGGWLSPVSGNSTGPLALHMMEAWKPSVFFLSATAFDADWGPSDPNPMEIEVKRHLAAKAQKVVLLADEGKFGKRSHAVTLHPRHLSAIVTNTRPPADIMDLAARHNIRLVYPTHPRSLSVL